MTPRLSCQNIHYRYGSTQLLQGLSFELKPQFCLGLYGPNGSGKTTLLKLIAGLLSPQQGHIYFNHQSLSDMSVQERSRNIAFLQQLPKHPPDFLVKDIVEMGRYPHKAPWQAFDTNDAQLIAKAMELFNLKPLANKKITQLSGGEQQRVWLAQSYVQQPLLLLLDESFAFMDADHKHACMKTLTTLQPTLSTSFIMISHDLSFLEQHCHFIASIEQMSQHSI